MKKQNQIIGACVLILVALTLGFYAGIQPLSVASSLNQIGDFSNRLMAITRVTSGTQNGTLVLRLWDGKTSFFPELTETRVSDTHRHAALFKGNDATLILDGDKVHTVSLNTKSGEMSDAQFSPNGQHIAFALKEKGRQYTYCIVALELIKKGQVLCNNVIIWSDNPPHGWLPSYPQYFAVQSSKNEVSLWDSDIAAGYGVYEKLNPLAFAHIIDELDANPSPYKLRCLLGHCVEVGAGSVAFFSLQIDGGDIKEIQTILPRHYLIQTDSAVYFVNTAKKSYFTLSLEQTGVHLSEESQVVVHE